MPLAGSGVADGERHERSLNALANTRLYLDRCAVSRKKVDSVDRNPQDDRRSGARRRRCAHGTTD